MKASLWEFLFIVSAAQSLNAFAGGDSLSAGIYSTKTGESLQARCLAWEIGDQSRVCTSIQFVETTNSQVINIGGVIKNVTASDMATPAAAPFYAYHATTPEGGPFKLTSAAWGHETGAITLGSSAGGLTALGLAIGIPILANNFPGIEHQALYMPKAPNNESLSQNLSATNSSLNVYFFNLDTWNTDGAGMTASGFMPNISNFFSAAANLTPEQRATYFTSNYISSESKPGFTIQSTLIAEYNGLEHTHIPIFDVTLARIEKVGKNYIAVFVPNDELTVYRNYIQTATAANNANYQAALAYYRANHASQVKMQKKYIGEYCSSIIGGSAFILAAPSIADLVRDACAYPALAIANKLIARKNKKIATEWKKSWNALAGTDNDVPFATSDVVFQAIVTAIGRAR